MNNKNNSTSSPEHQDETFFEDYLQGNSQLSDLYQKAAVPEPSDKLNQSILSAAKASTEKTSSVIPVKTHWWTQPASWAASIAIFSLVGLVAHNTWMAEQDASEKDFFQKPSVNNGSLSTPLPGKAKAESDLQTNNSAKPLAQAKKRIAQEEKNDSRKLLYKIKPAPVMQAAPAYMKRNKTGSVSDEVNTHIEVMEYAGDSIQPLPEMEEQKQISPSVNKKYKAHSTEQQLWLEKISQLIKDNQPDKARELMRQFRIKYPDYPIDPVILQHLSPY